MSLLRFLQRKGSVPFFSVGAVAPLIVLVASSCSEDTCKNPKTIDALDPVSNMMKHGPAIRCNAVLVCPRNGGRPDSRIALSALEDATFVDRGSKQWNEAGCKAAIQKKELSAGCAIEVSPESICLDAGGAAGGPGPDSGGPTGGTLVTVGAGTGGDFKPNHSGAGGHGGQDGAGGAGAHGGN